MSNTRRRSLRRLSQCPKRMHARRCLITWLRRRGHSLTIRQSPEWSRSSSRSSSLGNQTMRKRRLRRMAKRRTRPRLLPLFFWVMLANIAGCLNSSLRNSLSKFLRFAVSEKRLRCRTSTMTWRGCMGIFPLNSSSYLRPMLLITTSYSPRHWKRVQEPELFRIS